MRYCSTPVVHDPFVCSTVHGPFVSSTVAHDPFVRIHDRFSLVFADSAGCIVLSDAGSVGVHGVQSLSIVELQDGREERRFAREAQEVFPSAPGWGGSAWHGWLAPEPASCSFRSGELLSIPQILARSKLVRSM